MIRISTIAAIVFLASCSNAQNDRLFNSTGTFIGSKSAFHSRCINDLAEGVSPLYDFDAACSCILPTILELSDVQQARSSDFLSHFDFISALLSDPTARLRLETCMRASALHDTPIRSLSPEELQRFENSLFDIMSNPNIALPGVDVRALCQCYIQSLFAKNVTIGALSSAQDPNSHMYNEIMVPCINASKTMSETSPTSSVGEDVNGPSGPTEVTVSLVQGVHKVKVQIGELQRYFIIDSGAGDCFISKSFLDDLKQHGLVSPSDALEPQYYLLADGSQVLCDRYRIPEIRIGEYSVKDVVVAIIDQNIHFLLGKSALDKFSSWGIDASNSRLFLTK